MGGTTQSYLLTLYWGVPPRIICWPLRFIVTQTIDLLPVMSEKKSTVEHWASQQRRHFFNSCVVLVSIFLDLYSGVLKIKSSSQSSEQWLQIFWYNWNVQFIWESVNSDSVTRFETSFFFHCIFFPLIWPTNNDDLQKKKCRMSGFYRHLYVLNILHRSTPHPLPSPTPPSPFPLPPSPFSLSQTHL